jgi:hypothetical protein
VCVAGTGKAGSAEKDVLLLVTQRITANLTGAPVREWAAGLRRCHADIYYELIL